MNEGSADDVTQGFMAKAAQAQQRGGAGRGGFSPAQIQAAQQRLQSMGMGNADLQSMMRSMGGGAGGQMPSMESIQRMASQFGGLGGLGSMFGGGR